MAFLALLLFLLGLAGALAQNVTWDDSGPELAGAFVNCHPGNASMW
jgi:predicted transcriptional regulator